MAEKMAHIGKLMLNMYANRFKETPFLRKKVRELLFDGYYVGLIDTLQNITRKAILPNSTFGLYYGVSWSYYCKISQWKCYETYPTIMSPNFQKNHTDDGLYEIRTGRTDSSKFGEIVRWNGESELSWWGKSGGGDFCNRINGSDGSIFPPFVKKDRVVRIFSSDLCRSLYLTYTKEVEYKGVPALKFTIPEAMLADPVSNPENRCFCPNPDPVEEKCPKAGVILLSACRKGKF